MKKKLLLMVLLCSIGTLTSCFEKKALPEYEDVYFKFAVKQYPDESREAYLTGFTELGKEQKYLVLPPKIRHIEIKGLGYKYTKGPLIGSPTIEIGLFESVNLEKIYIPDYYFYSSKGKYELPNCFLVCWKSSCPLRLNSDSSGLKGNIVSYNRYKKIFRNASASSFKEMMIIVANVNYMYNYEGAENEGYYWVDSYDKDLIEFIPPKPQREGYIFGGWYKEKECINAWDFTSDITKEEIVALSYKEFAEEELVTYLYAKWYSIN